MVDSVRPDDRSDAELEIPVQGPKPGPIPITQEGAQETLHIAEQPAEKLKLLLGRRAHEHLRPQRRKGTVGKDSA